MSGFVDGENRHHATLFPERLDDYISADRAVRFIDVFVDDLDLSDRGFKAAAEATRAALACGEGDIVAYVAKTDTSGRRLKDEFGRNEFRYIAGDDGYECPAGERLIYRFTREEAGRKIGRYRSSAGVRFAIR